jgi:hypothetical protein
LLELVTALFSGKRLVCTLKRKGAGILLIYMLDFSLPYFLRRVQKILFFRAGLFFIFAA